MLHLIEKKCTISCMTQGLHGADSEAGRTHNVSRGGAPKQSAWACRWRYRSSTAESGALSLYASTLRLIAPLSPLKTCAEHGHA